MSDYNRKTQSPLFEDRRERSYNNQKNPFFSNSRSDITELFYHKVVELKFLDLKNKFSVFFHSHYSPIKLLDFFILVFVHMKCLINGFD